jgi:hypothetical protein
MKKVKNLKKLFCHIQVDLSGICNNFFCANSVRHRPEQNRVTWETPSSVAFPLLQEPIGLLASYAPHAQMQV